MTAFIALVRKDLRIFFGDRRAVIMAFAAPILIGSFFGYVFGPKPAQEQSRVRVLVVDEDRSEVTRGLLANEARVEAVEAGLAETRDAVRKGKAPVAVVVPKGFGEAAGQALFGAGVKPQIGVLFDPSHAVEASMVKGLLTGQMMQAVTRVGFKPEAARRAMDGASLLPGDKAALGRLLDSVEAFQARPGGSGGGGLSVPFAMADEAVTAGSGVAYNAYAHSFGGMAIQFMLFMGIDVGIGMLLLRQRGLWRRFRAAPLSKSVLLGSRAVSAMVMGMLILGVVFGFAYLVFDVRISGSLLGFLGVCAAFSLMTAAYGMLIAAIGKTPEAARGVAILGTLLMVMLSGAWVPSFLFPRWMQAVTMAVPARWAMDGLDAMTWRGLGVGEAVSPILVLLGSAVVFGGVAVWRFRWEGE